MVAKTSAVLAVSGGLVASLGLQASAAAPAGDLSAASTTADVTSQAASDVPASLTSGIVAAPSYGEVGFTAKKAPKPKRKLVVSVGREVRTSRSSVRTAIMTTPAPVSVKAGAPGSAEFGAAVIAIAKRYIGIAYRYGGTTPAGFDCSGFTGYVMRQVGIDLPRTAEAQRAATMRISRSEAVPGDLVFMPGHVGIYAGNGMMIDSPRTGVSVGLHQIWSSSATFGRVG